MSCQAVLQTLKSANHQAGVIRPPATAHHSQASATSAGVGARADLGEGFWGGVSYCAYVRITYGMDGRRSGLWTNEAAAQLAGVSLEELLQRCAPTPPAEVKGTSIGRIKY